MHPETGQILDADVVLTDGWIRYFNEEFADYMPLIATEGMGPETEAWLSEASGIGDPRVRFANPNDQTRIAAMNRARLYQHNGGSLMQQNHTPLMGDDHLTVWLADKAKRTACAWRLKVAGWTLL